MRVVPDKRVDAFARAKHEFDRAGRTSTTRNAALILVAPNARRMAVLGDRALHERVGEKFWNAIVAESTPYFARGDVDRRHQTRDRARGRGAARALPGAGRQRGVTVRRALLALVSVLGASDCGLCADFAVPPTPDHFVTDNAGALSDATRARVESELQSYERRPAIR